MVHHRDAIRAQVHVEFDRVGAGGDGLREGFDGIFGCVRPIATMPDDGAGSRIEENVHAAGSLELSEAARAKERRGVPLPPLDFKFHFFPWWKSPDYELDPEGVEITAEDLGEITWSDLTVGLDVHMLWTTPVGLMTYVGAGAAIHALNGHGDFVENTFVEDLLDSTGGGVAVMAGLEYQVVPRLRLYGEARYTLVTDIRYPGLRAGASLMLPPRDAAGQSR